MARCHCAARQTQQGALLWEEGDEAIWARTVWCMTDIIWIQARDVGPLG